MTGGEFNADEGAIVPSEESPRPAPRRAASAQLVVDAQVGSRALMREAMDPANQSLRDALRLSFRVLQAVILVLIVLFVFSGFQTVENQQTGVMLRWGRIVGDEGVQALEPGPHFSLFPYPAGEFVLFQDRNREVVIEDPFWQGTKQGQTIEQAIEEASTNQILRPGRDGYLLTAGGDIAHLQLRAQYEVDAPVTFINRVENTRARERGLDAERLVNLALQRAAVHTAARFDVSSFVAFGDEVKMEVRGSAQRFLDRLESGIRVADINTPVDPLPAFAIHKEIGELQQRRREVEQQIETARQQAQSTLLAVAGTNHTRLVEALQRHEEADRAGNAEEAVKWRDEASKILESEETSGEASEIVIRARSFQAGRYATLGNEARRFASILPSYRENPALVVGRLWAQAQGEVLARNDAEIFYVPAGLGDFVMRLGGNDSVAEIRREMMLQKRNMDSSTRGLDLLNPRLRSARDIRLSGPGRQYERGATGQQSGGGG